MAGEHLDVARLREAYEAFGKGDFDRLTELWSPELRWHEPGPDRLSGEYAGPSEVFDLFGRVVEPSGGSFRIDVRSVFADDTDGVAVVRLSAHCGDRTLDVLAAHVLRFGGDRVAEFREGHTDQAAVDEFHR